MDQKNQVVDRIKQANNILVTVSSNPSVDQLAACIGLTLLFNKAGKHATAVFSGAIPSTIEFLEPEKTIEKNTDSLRDFIIALDKSKADKLRYKVEDQVVRIFITPYRTSINEHDLEFSQGDFNVDVVLALGVHNQADLDQAITSHGRILHDATVVDINIQPGSELGSINWIDGNASSLSELAMRLATGLDQKLVDGQIATAFLTGIVAETNRFSNAKTSPETMSASATLMGLGANQQLVATKLEAPKQAAPAPKPLTVAPEVATAKSDGTLEITHDEKSAGTAGANASSVSSEQEKQPTPQIHIDEDGALQMPTIEPKAESVPKPNQAMPPEPVILPEPPEIVVPEPKAEAKPESVPDQPADTPSTGPVRQEGPHLILEPPTFGSQLTANVTPEDREASSGDPLTPPHEDAPILDREQLATTPDAAPVGLSIVPPHKDEVHEEDAQPPVRDTDSSQTSPVAVASASALPESQSQPASPAPVADDKPDNALAEVDDLLAGVTQEPAQPSTPSQAPVTDPIANLATNSLGASPEPTAASTVLPLANDDAIKALTESAEAPGANVDDARDAVTRAINNSANPPLEPTEALNAQPLGAPLHSIVAASSTPTGMVDPNITQNAAPISSVPAQPATYGYTDTLAQPAPTFTVQPPVSPTAAISDSTVPAPPVPPPMLPPVQL